MRHGVRNLALEVRRFTSECGATLCVRFVCVLTKVNRCDLASAKLGLKAMRQENERLLVGARRQASRIRDLEVGQARAKHRAAAGAIGSLLP